MEEDSKEVRSRKRKWEEWEECSTESEEWEDCSPEREEPMNVETLLALPLIGSDVEQDDPYVFPVKGTEKYLMEIALTTAEYDDFVEIVCRLADGFQDMIACFALEMTKRLTELSLPLINRPGPANESPVWQSFSCILIVILDTVKDDWDAVENMEPSILKVVNYIIGLRITKFYDVVVDVMAFLLRFHVCESLWKIFHDLCYIYVRNQNPRNVPFKKFIQVLYPYMVIDPVRFFTGPGRLQACINLCEITMRDYFEEEVNVVYVAKLLECLLLQCNGPYITESMMDTILDVVLRRILNPWRLEMDDLRPFLVLVVSAAMYAYKELVLNVLRAMKTVYLLDSVFDELLSVHKDLNLVHERKLALLGICEFLSLSDAERPAVIKTNLRKVIKVSVSLFNGLQRALQSRNMSLGIGMEVEDDADRESKSDSCEEHKSILDYMDVLAKEKALSSEEEDAAHDSSNERYPSFSDQDDPNGREESSHSDYGDCHERYLSIFDLDDPRGVFVRFKETLETLKHSEQELIFKMLDDMPPNEFDSLRTLLKLCERYERTEH